MRLELTEAAVEDLRAIREYTLQKWGERQEDIYLDRLWSCFGELLLRSSLHRFRHDLFPGCQVAAEGKHIIFFRVRKDVLQVVRVLHATMDFKRHLRED